MEALKILVVDDESRMRKLVKDFLTKKGFQVLEAGDGEEAMDLFYKEKDIALILLDVMMPRMDGWRCAVRSVKIPKFPLSCLQQEATRETSFWDSSLVWMNIFPSPSVRKFLWQE